MATSQDLLKIFDQKAELLFRPLLERSGYVLAEKKPIEINGHLWSIHHIYLHEEEGLRIIIKQEPCYTDYGFSIFIDKLAANESNILYNIPHEKQDVEGDFLNIACTNIFSSQELVDIIEGKVWKRLRYIPFSTSKGM